MAVMFIRDPYQEEKEANFQVVMVKTDMTLFMILGAGSFIFL